METQYEPIIEIGELIWVGVVYMIHASVLAMHTGLASFLLATGAHQLFAPSADGPWLRKLGFTPGEGPQTRRIAFARIGLGVMLLAPFAIGAPMGVSLLASVCSVALLIAIERGILLGLSVSDLRELYRLEEIRIADGPRRPVGQHLLEGGRWIFTPQAGTAGYMRLFGQARPPYRPRSERVRRLAAEVRASGVTGFE